MSSTYKRPHMHSSHTSADDKPWLKYPDSDKSHIHSRSFSPAPQKHHSPGLKHKRSSSKISVNSSNASLPMSLASNSSSDSLGHPHTLHARPKSRLDEPSLGPHTSIDATLSKFSSPISPADILGISDATASVSSPSSPSQSPQVEASEKTDADGKKPKPSPLSINTSFGGLNAPSFVLPPALSPTTRGPAATSDLGSPRVNLGVLGTPPMPGLSRSSHSSSASSSSYSNTSSPSSSTAPCSALCRHKEHGHHHHGHSHHHNHHHHSHCCQHKQERHRHHPSCLQHGSSSRPRSHKSKSHRYGAPQYVPHHEEEPVQSNTDDLAPSEEPLDIPEETTSTAVTIVGNTPAFGIASFREKRGEDGFIEYETEPPKKRQRSKAEVILGAAVETVIFTGAVALSAYQLLTGRGRQQLEAARNPDGPGKPIDVVFGSKEELLPETEVVPVKTAPVNIPTRNRSASSGHLLGKSLHHYHHKSKHSKKNGRSRAMSLPHAYSEGDDGMGDLALPERPNTGTEDDDEQFLRMEAQINGLIVEGKRALHSRIPNWQDA
ncbi:hypothetical protein BGX34_001717 [Mortierella sp. NVP85]|nr:hypothetical protein BGX34_001717 [Mortierella sp. NVP85]